MVMKCMASRDNADVKHIVKLMKSTSYRNEHKSFVTEGTRLCSDALESGINIEKAVFTEKAAKKYSDLYKKLEKASKSTIILTEKLFSQISDTKTPQGVLCVCRAELKKLRIEKGEVYLGLECIQDPSNMGTILRTAEALGVKGVIMSRDCCDILSPKVLRGTMGAAFRIPVKFSENITDDIEKCRSKGIASIATVLHENSVPITEISEADKKSCILLIGNEGNGLKAETVEKCSIKAVIPMTGKAESLNASAAAAICMWELLRR